MEPSENLAPLTLRKKVLFAVILVVGLPIALLAVAELGGRAYFHFKYGRPGKSYGIYMSDPELGATHRPSSYNMNSSINNRGFRNLEDISDAKSPGSTRVYCSGGSTTFCYNLSTEQAWPTRLQESLRQRAGHQRDEVINAGQICFPVASELTLARRVIPQLKPDVVVIFTAVNEWLASGIIAGADGKDFDELLRTQQWGVTPKHMDQERFLKRESILVRFIDYKFKGWFESSLTRDYRGPDAKPQPPHPWIMANFEHTLHTYIDFLHKEAVGRVIVVRWGDSGADNWFMKEERRFRDRGVEIAHELGAEVFDFSIVAEAHPQRQGLFIESGIHLTQAGANLFAERLGAFIAEGAHPATAAKTDTLN
jgi:lysophospholipase L1-like esterase